MHMRDGDVHASNITEKMNFCYGDHVTACQL